MSDLYTVKLKATFICCHQCFRHFQLQVETTATFSAVSEVRGCTAFLQYLSPPWNFPCQKFLWDMPCDLSFLAPCTCQLRKTTWHTKWERASVGCKRHLMFLYQVPPQECLKANHLLHPPIHDLPFLCDMKSCWQFGMHLWFSKSVRWSNLLDVYNRRHLTSSWYHDDGRGCWQSRDAHQQHFWQFLYAGENLAWILLVHFLRNDFVYLLFGM